jgi:predicted adenine nucleotide alpha hydrolase (AANH) superfamily ATPase
MPLETEILETRPEIKLEVPEGENKVLMHSCCAPCSGELMEAMIKENVDLTIFFYNPNIHPLKEYEIRKQENIRYAEKLGIPFVDADYNVQDWFYNAKGMENDPERGRRCSMCFDMRFVKTAEYAKANGFKVFTSSLGLSRWKDFNQINRSGEFAANTVGDVTYWTYNWRKEGGAARMYLIAKREEFYKQEYCGCIYSLRDTNNWREQNNREKIKIGEEFYGFTDEKVD